MSRRVKDAAMLFKPLADASALDRPVAAARPDPDVLRGGVLERGARHAPANAQAKAAVIDSVALPRGACEGLSLSGGASTSFSIFVKLSITFSGCSRFASETTKATSWVALADAAVRLEG